MDLDLPEDTYNAPIPPIPEQIGKNFNQDEIPRISSQEVIRALKKLNYEEDRQRGSHIVLRLIGYPYRRVTVPDHKEIAKGTLRTIIREAGLTVDEFKKLL
jgi:predicted RNA binding protein YcfA (HicA-like mRNA interferase family)